MLAFIFCFSLKALLVYQETNKKSSKSLAIQKVEMFLSGSWNFFACTYESYTMLEKNVINGSQK